MSLLAKIELHSKNAKIVDALKNKTVTENLHWYLNEVVDTWWLTHDTRDGMKKIRIAIRNPHESWLNVCNLRLSSHDISWELIIQLNELDRKFFFMLCKTIQKKVYESCLAHFANIS